MKIKNMLKTLAITSVPLVTLVAVACGNNSSVPKPNNYIEPANRLTKVNEKSSEGLEKEFIEKNKIVVITDAGEVTDKSFNQSAWEALLYTYDQLQKFTDNALPKDFVRSAKPATETYAAYSAVYDTALENGYKFWLLPGFKHEQHIKTYWAAKKNELKEAGVVIIGIDFNPDLGEDTNNNFGLNFKTEESSFIVGRAAAEFLAKKYPGDSNKDKRVLSSFGGGTFPGVTNFIIGFLEGVKSWNDTSGVDKVKVNGDTVITNSGFDSKTTDMTSAVQSSVSGETKLIFPVAGPATAVVLEKIKNTPEKLVIGVDTNQSLAFPEEASKFFSSVEKGMTQASYDVLIGLFKKQTATQIGSKLNKGYADKWVGYSATTLTGSDKTLAEAALTAAAAYFIDANNDVLNKYLKTIETESTKIQEQLNKLAKEINESAK
ncbi:BMP family ABC transporter substrate-binding protein [Candidatus Mycoplasma pogonae]